MKKIHYKDYTYEEWLLLPEQFKRDIIHHYWNPYDESKGKSTRKAIITNFKKEYPNIAKNALKIDFGYFGFYAECLFVIKENPEIRIPKKYASLPINKGVAKKRIGKKVIVDWRLIGGPNTEMKL
jgi:hypothetical protein